MRLYWDIEATNLLNSDSVDYTQSPYQLKPDFKVHCAVFIDVDTEKEYEFVGHEELLKVKDFIVENATELIAQNSISYDHMVMMAMYGIDFEIGVNEGEPGKQYSLKVDSVRGVPMTITDTLVMSKTLNPTRAAHSIDYFGRLLGLEKIDWRGKAIELGLIQANDPPGAEFKTYHPEMLVYCKRDCYVGIKVWKFLMNEWGTWNWDDAYQLEKAVAEIITHQEHRGFYFHKEKAIELVKDLDEKMEKLRAIVEPLIPPKPIGKTAAKEFIPPKNQFKKDGSLSANIIKWVEKHGGKIEEGPIGFIATVFDKQYALPIPQEPIVTHVPSNIEDTTHIKGWLVGMGWKASQYKERDLTVDSRKQKLSLEKYVETVERYIAQTMESPFKRDRMEHLEVRTEKAMRDKLLKHDHIKRPMKVYTNPTLTVGVEKEIDPKLLEMQDKFAHAQDVSNYLTYRHRRNSILGGGIDPDDDDEEMQKGWMSVDRINQDHRIPTPADTCGAATSRFKHRLVANIPRITSLYGEQMRSLFGVDVDAGYYQLGYDFSSLEAMIEASYCWRYDGDEKSYCMSLIRPKPDDVHTITATKISAAIKRAFGRTPAKSVKYCCAYGGQPPRVAKTVGCSLEEGKLIFDAYWEAAAPLGALGSKVKAFWETSGGKKFVPGLDGRKVPTRSASALINSLFQSAGVICAKRAMVIHDRMMKAEGLKVNFWKEDWRNKKFSQQLIAYHDEAQIEVHKSLIKWKVFAAEEDAKLFKRDNPGWSEIGHSDKGFYIGWCKVGELIQQAVKETSRYYKLNVDLSADYILGRNWGECH
jgi:DNA polymerase I-like protein with 3'-5' exonuclease and polymerase domains